MLELFENHPFLKKFEDSAVLNKKISVQGLKGSSVALALAYFFKKHKGKHLFVTAYEEKAMYLFDDLKQLAGSEENIYFMPHSGETIAILNQTDHHQTNLRLNALQNISQNENFICVTYARGLIEKVPNKQMWQTNKFTIHQGEKIDLDFLIEFLVELKFEREDYAIEPGQFSIRGNIIDIYSPGMEFPCRIVLDDEKVEKIKLFDPDTLSSIKEIKHVDIFPDVLHNDSIAQLTNIFEFSGPDTVVWWEDKSWVNQFMRNYLEEGRLDASIHLLPDEFEKLTGTLKEIFLHPYEKTKEKVIELEAKTESQPLFHKNFKILADSLNNFRQKNYRLYFLSKQETQYKRIASILNDIQPGIHLKHLPIALSEGFIDHHSKSIFYTDHQIFDRYHKPSHVKTGHNASMMIQLKELSQLKPGDYVVHIDHGIGRFSGLEKIDVGGRTQEALRIIYKNNDVLYVNIHSLHKISRYTGEEGKEPALDKLGGGRWQMVKLKTKKKVKELAFDLIQLYAKRKTSPGFAFSPDNYLQEELEASFIYEDTPDQAKITREIKNDMEKPYPMDRLVCGDVGFGKTELAIRAAFKAVCDSKQVAVLVPTTVLALQHFKTFSDRLKDFPCKVDYVNRMKKPSEIKQTLQQLKEGKIDIIIGTHRLLSKDVKFKDLGLLIIDEEHKFGVGDKEKIRNLKVNVDTLTLTATPIPRTLQFSLMGARDLSIMTTPPPNRRPVKTKAIGFNADEIREAILYEINRNGQVFFIHNRIENLDEITGWLSKICPGVRFRYAHGRMKGSEIEEIITGFVEREFDVLVSTTIVESGIDIPNANTIFINHAHQFGLSDLHQLRGRVGRSNREAFCYLIIPPISTLTSDASKRIRSLLQFTDLGSGFHIAMRDLDIRGAGNILGAEQSGFISEIGFDTYQKILEEAIRELKQNEFKEIYRDENVEETNFVSDCNIETDWELFIPENYIPNLGDRLTVYQKIDQLQDTVESKNLLQELEDKYGKVPETIHTLIDLSLMRSMFCKLGIEKVVLKQGRFLGYFIDNPENDFYKSETFGLLLQFIQKYPAHFKLKQIGSRLQWQIEQVYNTGDLRKWMDKVLDFLWTKEKEGKQTV